MSYYHVTSYPRAKKILNDGLKAGIDGYIYLFCGGYEIPASTVAIHIANYQVFRSVWTVLRVDPAGITAAVEQDLVGEKYAVFQYRIQQSVIPCNFLSRVFI